jgi:hypothetical protein
MALEWISVEDKLPEEGDFDILTSSTSPDEVKFYNLCFFEDNIFYDEDEGWPIYNVTHWLKVK